MVRTYYFLGRTRCSLKPCNSHAIENILYKKNNIKTHGFSHLSFLVFLLFVYFFSENGQFRFSFGKLIFVLKKVFWVSELHVKFSFFSDKNASLLDLFGPSSGPGPNGGPRRILLRWGGTFKKSILQNRNNFSPFIHYFQIGIILRSWVGLLNRTAGYRKLKFENLVGGVPRTSKLK